MTDDGPRMGVTRDVPPPRPVPSSASAVPVEDSGLARAARAVADAVGGLLGGPARTDPDPAAGRRSGAGAAASGLRDVVGAVASAVGSAFGPGRAGDAPPASAPPGPGDDPTSGERTPSALLGDLLAAAAPRLPIRDADRLRRAYPGARDDEIADALVARTARLTAGIGAATGGLSAAHWFAPASLLALPLELGAETVLIGAVEVVLIGELHELHGQAPAGDARDRAAAYLASWSTQRAVDGGSVPSLGALLGTAGFRALRTRITRRLAGAVPSAAPLLLGAALGGRVNRRATETLAHRILVDLRSRRPA